ncbi:MAG: tripartite tricarboxylate transporter TctB family protein [Rubrivivax sp.]|nr:tripartite tricarboxylate transporter TctB family protein [Rubrivivax sp.]MDP3082992.1 tripartite tricarboxylate transporter TctB family protein [Rubrivivax sp.]
MSKGADAARADRRGGLGWIALGALILVASWRMDRFEAMGGSLYTAPGLVPGLLGIALMLLGGLLAWRGWRARGRSAPGPGPLLNGRIAGMLVLSLVYAAGLIGRVPFAPATALFVTLFTAIYAGSVSPARRWGVALLAGALTTLLVVGVFERIFLVRLP